MVKVMYNGRMRKLYDGSRGGKYVISSGRKVYLKVKSSKKKAPAKRKPTKKKPGPKKKKKSTSGLRMPRMSNLRKFKLFGGDGFDDIEHTPSDKTSPNPEPFVHKCSIDTTCSIDIGNLMVDGGTLSDKQVKDYVREIYNSEYKNDFLVKDQKSVRFNNNGKEIKSALRAHYEFKPIGNITDFENRLERKRNIDGLKLLIVSFLARRKFHDKFEESRIFKQVNRGLNNKRKLVKEYSEFKPWKTTLLTEDEVIEYEIPHPLF